MSTEVLNHNWAQIFRSTDRSTVLDSKMAPKLTWGWKRRTATVPVAARATPTYIYRRLLELYFPTFRNMAVPSSSGLNQSRDNWMKVARSVGYYLRKDIASLRTGLEIFHFSPISFGYRNVNGSDSQHFPKRRQVPSQTMPPALYTHCTHCKFLRPVTSSPLPLT
jgi:hypothetical protein